MSNWERMYDAIASLLSLLSYTSASELRELERELTLASPALLAWMTSRGRWQLAPHLVHLDRAILEAIDEAAAGELDGLVVSMPPQHGKSELSSRYLPAWYLGTFPERRVILVGYEADFAADWGRKARSVLEQFGHLFGVRVARSSSAAHRWELEGHAGGMTSAGIGGPITGRGAHLLIIDDPVKNDEEARSASFRQKQWEWWQSVASTRLRPGGLVVLIQTRWHRGDLSGRILQEAAEGRGRWREIKLPALAEAEADDPLGRSPGEALWPEMYSQERLERIKAAQTPYYWQALYQQNPIAEGSSEWPADYFGPEIWFDDWPTDWLCKTVALDPSKGSDAKFGDYSAFVLLLVSRDGLLYVDADLQVRNTAVMIDTALEIQRSFRPDWFGIETNQCQELLAAELLRLSQERRILLPLCTLNNQVNKQVRIRRLTPYLALRRLRFKGDSPGARLLVEQLRDFPHADHDDGPDALEMAERLAGELLQRRSIEEPVDTYVYT